MNQRVLIVEDTEDIRILMRIVLSAAGFEVHDVNGGAEAIEWLGRETVPALVVLDVQMPLMDGWETLREIRARAPEVPVVLCTVKSRPVDQRLGWELGCDGYISKPFDVDQLVHQLRDVISRTAAQRERVRVVELARVEREIASQEQVTR